MRFTGFSAPVALAAVLTLASPAGLLPGAVVASAAQRGETVTSAEIQRLQDAISDAAGEVSALRSRDSRVATELQSELDSLRDETVYLQVKLRKSEAIDRREYAELRDRIDAVRSRARNDASDRPAPSRSNTDPDRDTPSRSTGGRTTTNGSAFEVPVGTEFDVRLQDSLSSGSAQVEDRFEGTTMVDLSEHDRLLIPAGSVVRGVVSSVTKAGRVERKGSMTVAFDQITVDDRRYPIRATVTEAIESEGVKGEAGKIGAGAGVGAIIGGILGGFKGALAGILIGGGGTIAATDGKDAELPSGTVLRVRLDSVLRLDRDAK